MQIRKKKLPQTSSFSVSKGYYDLFFLGVLALYYLKTNQEGFKLAYLINPHGDYDRLYNFEFGYGTEIDESCSLLWHNHYYVFGGQYESQQVSMVNGNRLERKKPDLDFNLYSGGCTVLNQATIVLCFDFHEKKLCRQSNHPFGTFTKLQESTYSHKFTRIASFDGKNKFH